MTPSDPILRMASAALTSIVLAEIAAIVATVISPVGTLRNCPRIAWILPFLFCCPAAIGMPASALADCVYCTTYRLRKIDVNDYIATMAIWSPIVQRGNGPLYLAIADAIARDMRDGALPP